MLELIPEGVRESVKSSVMGEMSKTLSPSEMKSLRSVDTTGPKSFFIDPQLAFDLVGYVRREKPLTAPILRDVAFRDKIIAAIIKLRKNQIKNFTRRYAARSNDSGWKISLKDSEKSPTASDQKRIDEASYFVENMGFPSKDDAGPPRDRLPMFVDKIVEDSLVLDAASFERVFDYAGNLAEVYAVDGGTIRMVHREVENASEYIRYAQEWQGQILAYFTSDELAYCPRNQRTDIRTMGYGLSEVEMTIETVTAHLFAEQWNARFFNQGSIPQGILSITGNVSQETLEAFKRNWLVQVSGVQNAWRVPVIGVPEGKGVQWIPFHQAQRDMEFHEWLRYLVSVICAIFQCDPSELGFESYRGGATDRTLFEARGEFKITASQDKGLFPLMKWVEEIITDEIIKYIYPDLCFRWVGLRDKSERENLEFQQMELAMGKKTVNMIRAEEDLPPIEEDWANAPGNPTLVQVFMQKYQLKMQQEMQEQQAAAMGGMGGMPPGMPPGGMPPEGPPPTPEQTEGPDAAQNMIGQVNQLAGQVA